MNTKNSRINQLKSELFILKKRNHTLLEEIEHVQYENRQLLERLKSIRNQINITLEEFDQDLPF